MELTIDNFRDIQTRQIEAGSFVDKKQWEASINKLDSLKVFIDEMIRIIKINDNIPEYLKNNANSYATRFIGFIQRITEDIKGQPAEIANKKEQILRELDGWYKECIEKLNYRPEQLGFYETFNTLMNLDKNNFVTEYTEINNLKNKILSDKNSIDTIFKELQKKTSSITMSDYAKIFGTESSLSNKASWIWLFVGIGLVILFLSLLLFTEWYDKFPTEDVLSDGITIKYNITNLLIKLLIFAVQIFMISFSFKQYSISKHLSTINKHRQNGLDSFKLFVESISKEDTETRNSLMLQLAKAIYEQTSTGYISDKNQGVNSGIIEITKMIGANRL